MADVLEDDQWLYGETPDLNSGEIQNESENSEQAPAEPRGSRTALANQALGDGPPGVDIEEKENGEENQGGQEDQDGMEDGEVRQNGDDSEKEDLDDDSDDDVNVVIGDIKATKPSYTSLNIKRGGLAAVGDKSKQIQQQGGKFAVEEFEQIGTINGVPSHEFNLDSLEDKPWRKPGADITDYFNYGFNEDTWRAYCERQKRMRVNESGAGLIPMNPIGNMPRGPISIMNDNSKYNNNFIGMMRHAGPPPSQRLMGGIDVIGGMQRQVTPISKLDQPKMNIIQVMTADRREYSRKPANFPDLSVPPPSAFESFQPEFGFNPEPEPFYGGYEPTQDSQWGTEPPPGWTPSELKTLTGGPPAGPPPAQMGPPVPVRSPSRRGDSPHKEGRERDRERGESRARSEKPRDRERERSHRRDRSRSRSRRHKSRSRSPGGHRTHRKKKSRRHEDSE